MIFMHHLLKDLHKLLLCLILAIPFNSLANPFNSNRRGPNLGDETDVIIKNILSEYEKDAHPNSERSNGAVVVRVGELFLKIQIQILFNFENSNLETVKF